MDINGTGSQLWPLTTGNNDSPTLSQGAATSFFCNTIPDRAPGGLAYYLPYVLLTFSGSVTQPASGGSPIPYDLLRQCIVDSIDWITAWHGTVVSANHVKGKWLPVVEFVAGGYGYATRQSEIIPGGQGVYPFELTIAVPASSCRVGNLGGNTSQLALLFQTSQLKINVANSSVIGTISTGATLGTTTARASAKIVPSSELILGTPVEWIMEQTVAGSSSYQIQIKGFGTDTLITGVENKGGVLWLGELTNVNNQGGVFAAEHVTGYSNPWRNQQQTYHPQSIISDFLSTLPDRRPQVFPVAEFGGDSEYAGYPYAATNSNQATTVAAVKCATNLLFWPMAYAGKDIQLTDAQTADSDQSYFLNLDTTFSAGSHLILGAYARRFTRDMRMNWVGQVSKGGSNSLAAHVLGPNWQSAVNNALKNDLRQRVPRSRHIVTADQMTYLPFQLA